MRKQGEVMKEATTVSVGASVGNIVVSVAESRLERLKKVNLTYFFLF